MAKKSYDLLFKLLLIGDSGVGKTCLLLRYCDNIYSSNFISTIGIDFKIKTVEIGGKKIKLQIWDTAGQERFQTITTSYYRGAMGIMLVYDVTNRKSFDNVSKWVNAIQTHAQDNVEKMLVANKCDDETRRVISKENGLALSRAHNIPIHEASAKTGENVSRAFEELTLSILQKLPSSASPQSGNGLAGNKLTNEKNDRTGRCCQ